MPKFIAEVVRRCPTGALYYRLASGDAEQCFGPATHRKTLGRPKARPAMLLAAADNKMGGG